MRAAGQVATGIPLELELGGGALELEGGGGGLLRVTVSQVTPLVYMVYKQRYIVEVSTGRQSPGIALPKWRRKAREACTEVETYHGIAGHTSVGEVVCVLGHGNRAMT